MLNNRIAQQIHPIRKGEFVMYNCAKCGLVGCAQQDLQKTLPDCPSKNSELQSKALKEYEKEEIHRIAYKSACVEAEGYCNDTRMVEIINLLKRCNYKKIGFAFCRGLHREAR